MASRRSTSILNQQDSKFGNSASPVSIGHVAFMTPVSEVWLFSLDSTLAEWLKPPANLILKIHRFFF
jgi:hypothetical protein